MTHLLLTGRHAEQLRALFDGGSWPTAADLVSVPEAASAVVISPDGKIDRNRQRHRMSDTSRLNPVGVVFCFAR